MVKNWLLSNAMIGMLLAFDFFCLPMLDFFASTATKLYFPKYHISSIISQSTTLFVHVDKLTPLTPIFHLRFFFFFAFQIEKSVPLNLTSQHRFFFKLIFMDQLW